MIIEILKIVLVLNFLIVGLTALVAAAVYLHVVGSLQETFSLKSLRRRFYS